METEKEIVKIRTFKGRIVTLTIHKKTATHYYGKDKYEDDVIIPIEDIDSLIPIHTSGGING